MSQTMYRFEIDQSVPITDAEQSLHLAMIALEGIYGPAGVRLDARYHLDEGGRAIVVDGSTAVGSSLVRVFSTLLTKEFGDDAARVIRSEGQSAAEAGK